MSPEVRTPPRRHVRRTAIKIALIYALVGVLWIVFSDQLLAAAFREREVLTRVQSLKGVFYISVTAVLLYWLVRVDLAAIESGLARLERSEARYRSIVEAASNAIVGLDQDLRVREWNRGAEELLGWKRDEVLGRAYLPLAVPPAQHEPVAEAIRAGLNGERVRGYANDVLTRDGQTRHMLWNANALDPGDGRREVIAIGEDLTTRKSLEAQLYQAQKMEALGLLASGISHDINNVLTAIMGCTDLARGALEAESPRREEATEHLDQIEQAAQRAALLTRQLLTFSRRGVVHAELFDPRARLAALESMLRRLVHESIALVVERQEPVWPIRMDPGQFEQLVMNLVVNARDAMPRGGRLTIAVRNVELGLTHRARHPDARLGPHVEVLVRDTGTGIDPRTLERIFEPFFTTKPPGKGTGLGLATVHGMIRQLGGHVAVESEVGVGTTFRVHLPAEPDGRLHAAAPDESRRSLRGSETVVLCEDDDLVRQLAERALRTQGYRVLASKLPSEALRHVDAVGGLDLLVTNVALPEMDGIELAERVRERCSTARTLFISGYGEDVVSRGGEVGEEIAFLGKPFTAEEIARRVREVLARGPAHHFGFEQNAP